MLREQCDGPDGPGGSDGGTSEERGEKGTDYLKWCSIRPDELHKVVTWRTGIALGQHRAPSDAGKRIELSVPPSVTLRAVCSNTHNTQA